ncbi:vacuolar sorting protein Vps24 [Lactarius hatsudake]|nr:vacuolar sorting protein Vps24 [Lactarius hatsudake]
MQTINRFLYGPTPEEAHSRVLDRETRQVWLLAVCKGTLFADSRLQLDIETNKLAKKGDIKSARILAREVVRSNKQKDRLSVSKARLGSIGTQLSQQLAMAKVSGSLQKSTEIMKLSNNLIKLPQISQTMREMSMEMTKAGIMEEMLDDALDVEEDEEVEEEADEEVDKVLFELTNGKLGQAGAVNTELPVSQVDEEQAEREMERYREQLNGLLSG